MTEEVQTSASVSAPVPQEVPVTPEGGALAEYEVEAEGGGTYTVQLTEADAKAQGAKPAEKPAAGSESSAGADDTGTSAKAAAPANKRHTPSNK